MMTADRTEDRDGNRHYTYPPTGEQLVSVTTVLGATEGKPWLPPWAAGITAAWAVDNMDLLAKTLEAEGRAAAVKLAKRESERIRDVKRDAGSYVHDVVEALIYWGAAPGRAGSGIALPLLPDHLAGADYDDDPLDDVVGWMIDGFCNFVADFGPGFEAAEMTVYNAALGIAGTLDMIVVLRGVAIGPAGRLVPAPGNVLVLCVDVKTGKHLSVTWREQVACYRRMAEALMPMGEIVAMPATEAAAVLHLRPEHDGGYRLMLVSGADDGAAWETFQAARRTYQDRAAAKPKPGKVIYPLRADGTIRQPRLADLDGEGYGRVPGSLARAGVGDIGDLAGLDAAGCLALHGVGPKSVPVIRQILSDHGLHLKDETTTAPARKAA